MTPAQEMAVHGAVNKLSEIKRGDAEDAHEKADEILLTLLRQIGLGEVSQAWSLVNRECGGFWYA